MNRTETFKYGLAMIVLALCASTANAQAEKRCTFSVRTDWSWKSQELAGLQASGNIVGHSIRSNSGNCTYLVDQGSIEQQILKLYSPEREAIDLGTLTRNLQARTVTFTPTGGMPIVGQLAVPLSNGIMVMRESAVFIYESGQAVQAYPLPAGWSPFPIQQGDVLGTQAILLVKTADEGGVFRASVGASLLNIPEAVRIKYGMFDLKKKIIVTEFVTSGRYGNNFVALAGLPKDDWPYSFNPLIQPARTGAFINSPADWFMAGSQPALVHFDKGLTQIWVKNLGTGKAKLVSELPFPLGMLNFYATFGDGKWNIGSEGKRILSNVEQTLQD
jgi:hypothetical protein